MTQTILKWLMSGDGQWHLFAIVWRDGQEKLYIDGMKIDRPESLLTNY